MDLALAACFAAQVGELHALVQPARICGIVLRQAESVVT